VGAGPADGGRDGGANADRVRLFVAVDVPEPVRTALWKAAAPLRQSAPKARWVTPERWHLTLQFLGHLEVERVPDVEAALAAASLLPPFELALSGQAGHFGGRVVWAGLAPSDGLAGLAAAVREQLAARALPVDDRPFRAHLTLARASGRSRLPAPLLTAALPGWRGPRHAWTVEAVELVRSVLGRGGSMYTVVGRWPLAA
jgi:RNA 2',3'-cyclic 3'-phosphodiesterase